MDAGQWIAVIVGVVLGFFFYWVGTHGKQRRADRDLDDWDQQDQLEGDDV